MARALLVLAMLVLMLSTTACADEPIMLLAATGPVEYANIAALEQADVSADEEANMKADENEEADQPLERRVVKKKQSTPFGLMIGLYTPISGTVKDVFGDSWVRYGFRPLPTKLTEHRRVVFDISYYSMSSKNDDDVVLIPLTVGLMQSLSRTDHTHTYASVNVGPYYGDVSSPTLGINKTGWGLNANATVGIMFNNKLSLEARYEFMDEFAGLDFSAFTISAAYKVFSARF